MALIDAKARYADAVSISTSAATHTALIGNVVDHGPLASGNTSLNLNLNNLYLNVRVTTAAYSSNVGTLMITFYTADNSAMTGSAAVFTVVPAAVASVGWTAGQQYLVPLPSGTYKRYSQLHLTGATHVVTAGAVTVALVDTGSQYTAFAQDASIY